MTLSHTALIVDTATKTRLMEKYALPESLSEEDFYLWERYDAIGHKFLRSFLKARDYSNGFYCGVILQKLIVAATLARRPPGDAPAELDLPPSILARIAAEAAKPLDTPFYQEIAETAKKSRDASSRTAGAEMEACLRKNGLWDEHIV